MWCRLGADRGAATPRPNIKISPIKSDCIIDNRASNEGQMKVREDFTIREKAPTGPWVNMPAQHSVLNVKALVGAFN